jgi:hypothetical protein
MITMDVRTKAKTDQKIRWNDKYDHRVPRDIDSST